MLDHLTHLVVCCRSFVVIAFGVGNLMGIDRLGAVAAGPKQVLFFSLLAKRCIDYRCFSELTFFFCGRGALPTSLGKCNAHHNSSYRQR